MSRKHFEALAWALRQQALRIIDQTELSEDARFYRQRQWDQDVLAVADVCGMVAAFDDGRFLIAAGYTPRPDGSMYPSNPPR